MTEVGELFLAYQIASRLAYVIWVGVALTRQRHDQRFTRRDGVEAGFRRFRRTAALLMNNDGVAFVALCLVTRGSLLLSPPLWVTVVEGSLLVLVGVSIKVWAAVRLGAGAYYWRNFFAPDEPVLLDPPGPYRFLKNPMYTLGYLQTYGLALVFRSWPGLIAAAIAQAAILAFHALVEKPHFDRLTGTA
ncbi:MAG TPA: methyltransferase [Gemmatimonadales bacterium]|nr:methyltransferase [Gemmatimonadales bacterium]